jgi:hypothetical protein
MKLVRLSLIVISALTAAPDQQKFTGIVTDSMCIKGDHSKMQMGPTDAECTVACIKEHDATYVLYDGKDVYELSDQKSPENFAAKKVTVTGILDAKTKTIKMTSIVPAK